MNADSTLSLLDEHGITRIRLGTFDLDGVLRGKYVSRDKLASAIEAGMGFCDVLFGWDMNDDLYDRESLTGWHTGYPDALVKIDVDSFRIVPWEPGTALFLMDMFDRNGEPYPLSARHLLGSLVAQAADAGYTFRSALEYEYFFFRESAQTVNEKGFRDLTPLSPGMFGYSASRASVHSDLVHHIIDAMNRFDVPLEGIHTETGPGVYETAIRYDEGVAPGDKGALFKAGIKELAPRHDLLATFMAKWSADLPGCSGHAHQSLFDAEGKNAFADGQAGFSTAAMHYLGGLLHLLPALTPLFCPTVNSYKRAVPGAWSPINVGWGVENRTTSVRAIPGTSASSTRLECRVPGADANPHLVLAGCLAAGLHGLSEKIDPPEAVAGNAYEDASLPPLPTNLANATQAFGGSEAIRSILGDTFVDHYVMTRDYEVRQYEKAVTDWELRRYFEVI